MDNQTGMKIAVALSKDSLERVKVGCFLTFKDSPFFVTGFNQKDVNGQIIHAEVNTLKYAFPYAFPYKPDTLYTNKAPCNVCARAIVKAGIQRVVCPQPYKINPFTGLSSKWFLLQKKALMIFKLKGVVVDYEEIQND